MRTLGAALRTFLTVATGRCDSLVLVSHSQGGLVVQQCLAGMIADGRGLELTRVREIVMFACPNAGSEFLIGARRRLWFWQHPQEQALRPLNDTIAETRRTVLKSIVYARDSGPSSCHIPIAVYAAASDNVVQPASALDAFPTIGVLPGDHSSVIQPDGPEHPAFLALKMHLIRARNCEIDPVTATTPTARMDVSDATVHQVANAVAAVPAMRDPDARQRVWDALPKVVTTAAPGSSVLLVDLFWIVRACLEQPAGLTRLLAAVRRETGESSALDRLTDVVNDLRPPGS
jgi:hypothetical protein